MKFNWEGAKATKKSRKAAAKSLSKVSEGLLTEANKTVPNDEGTLERSGSTDVDERKLVASVFYDTPYAIRLHESEAGEYNFRGNGQRKWLERTSNKMSSKLEAFFAKEMKKEL